MDGAMAPDMPEPLDGPCDAVCKPCDECWMAGWEANHGAARRRFEGEECMDMCVPCHDCHTEEMEKMGSDDGHMPADGHMPEDMPCKDECSAQDACFETVDWDAVDKCWQESDMSHEGWVMCEPCQEFAEPCHKCWDALYPPMDTADMGMDDMNY